MRSILILLFLQISFLSYAQDGYFKKFKNGTVDNESATHLIKLNEKKLVIVSTADPDDGDLGWHIQLRVVEIETGIVDTLFNFSPAPGFSVSPEEYIINKRGNLVFACGTKDNALPGIIQSLFLLVEIDLNEGVLWSQIYGEDQNLNWRPTDITQLEDGGYAVAGYGFHPVSERAEGILLKTSSVGDSLWVRKYHDPPFDTRAFTAEAGPGNTCFFHYGVGDPEDQGSIKLELIDGLEGTRIWDKKIPLESPLFYLSMINSRGNLVLGGNKNINNQITPHYAEIDPEGNLLWANSYEDMFGWYYAEQFEQTNEGGYIMCVRGTYPTLFAVNKNGKYLFEKTYEIESTMSPTDLFQLEDGSFVIMGYEGATQEYTTWLIKTSPEGDLVSVSGIEANEVSIDVYPNPSADYVKVETSLVGEITGNLVDLSGRVLQTQVSDFGTLEFNLNMYPSGIYYINIFNGNEFYASEKVIKQ